MNEDEPAIELHAGGEVTEFGKTKVPKWLIASYIFWFAIGLMGFFLYWNGSSGFLDRGQWHSLQEAAKTTFPYHP